MFTEGLKAVKGRAGASFPSSSGRRLCLKMSPGRSRHWGPVGKACAGEARRPWEVTFLLAPGHGDWGQEAGSTLNGLVGNRLVRESWFQLK